MGINLFIIMRVLIGGVFVVSGFEKLIGPYQNFLYVIQGYELFPEFSEHAIAHVMPWVELFLGVFLILGLWSRAVMKALLVLTTMFILVVAQAILRGLSMVECGCFGDFVSIPLHGILMFDSIMALVLIVLIRREKVTTEFSLDRYFENREG